MLEKLRNIWQSAKSRNLHLACAIVLAALAFAHPMCGHAETIDLGSMGVWTAFGGTTEDGKPVCGISTNSNQRALLIKWFKGENELTAQVFKNTWNIPAGARASVRVQFDRYTPWSASAVGRGKKLEFTIPVGNVSQFEYEVRTSSKMRIAFSGAENDWEGGLAGAGEMMNLMVRCMNVLAQETQPYSNSQPYSIIIVSNATACQSHAR